MNEDLITFALRNEMNGEELLAYILLRRENVVSCNKYVDKFGKPPTEAITRLLTKGLIISKSYSNPDFDNSIVSRGKQVEDEQSRMDMAEELWQAYPASFPLSDGGRFIARKGPDKTEVLKLYLERIKNDPEKHKFVLEQLRQYIKLVLDRKINGLRIYEWISNEIWDSISAIKADSKGGFKTDIN